MITLGPRNQGIFDFTIARKRNNPYSKGTDDYAEYEDGFNAALDNEISERLRDQNEFNDIRELTA